MPTANFASTKEKENKKEKEKESAAHVLEERAAKAQKASQPSLEIIEGTTDQAPSEPLIEIINRPWSAADNDVETAVATATASDRPQNGDDAIAKINATAIRSDTSPERTEPEETTENKASNMQMKRVRKGFTMICCESCKVSCVLDQSRQYWICGKSACQYRLPVKETVGANNDDPIAFPRVRKIPVPHEDAA